MRSTEQFCNTLLARECAAAATTANTISIGCISSIYRLHLSKSFPAHCASFSLGCAVFCRIVATLRIDSVTRLLSQGNTQPNSSVCSVQGIPAFLPQPFFLTLEESGSKVALRRNWEPVTANHSLCWRLARAASAGSPSFFLESRRAKLRPRKRSKNCNITPLKATHPSQQPTNSWKHVQIKRRPSAFSGERAIHCYLQDSALYAGKTAQSDCDGGLCRLSSLTP